MDQMKNGFIIIGMLIVVVFVGAVRRKAEWVINFLLRMVMGTIGIYFINYLLAYYGLEFDVAINPFSVLTSGFLGIPGLAVLYGINFYKFL